MCDKQSHKTVFDQKCLRAVVDRVMQVQIERIRGDIDMMKVIICQTLIQ